MTKASNLSQKHLQQTFTQQHDQSDCGVACLLSIIQYYEGSNNLEKLRELSGTTKQGTTLLGLYQAANKLGFTAQGNEAMGGIAKGQIVGKTHFDCILQL